MKRPEVVKADLRTRVPLGFGDEATRQQYERQLESMRNALPEGMYVVAPMMRVRTARGLLGGGERLTAEDIADVLGIDGAVVMPASARLAYLIDRGVVVGRY